MCPPNAVCHRQGPDTGRATGQTRQDACSAAWNDWSPRANGHPHAAEPYRGCPGDADHSPRTPPWRNGDHGLAARCLTPPPPSPPRALRDSPKPSWLAGGGGSTLPPGRPVFLGRHFLCQNFPPAPLAPKYFFLAGCSLAVVPPPPIRPSPTALNPPLDAHWAAGPPARHNGRRTPPPPYGTPADGTVADGGLSPRAAPARWRAHSPPLPARGLPPLHPSLLPDHTDPPAHHAFGGRSPPPPWMPSPVGFPACWCPAPRTQTYPRRPLRGSRNPRPPTPRLNRTKGRKRDGDCLGQRYLV